MKAPFPKIAPRTPESGITILETVISLAILLVVTVGIMSLATIAVETTENQGHLEARAAEYAQDKMEQLIGLAYGDSTTDTTQFPAVSTGGTGLTVGGSTDPANPVTGYVDYLDATGTPVASTANWYYIRVWEIDTPSGTTDLKRITVTAKVRASVGGQGAGAIPEATVASLKACIGEASCP